MYDYYCKNCDNLIGQWNKYHKWYDILKCYFLQSKNCKSIFFLDCKNCDKFVGIFCYHVCKICFGKNEILGEENLFNWFSKYKKIIKKYSTCDPNCKNCDKNIYRSQFWFFDELTFHK